MSEKITIEVEARTALVAHIESLQRVITDRNKRIAELEARLEGEGESEFIQRAKQRAYAAGYKAAADALVGMTHKFKDVLEHVNNRAFDVWLEGDRIGWDNKKYAEMTGGGES